MEETELDFRVVPVVSLQDLVQVVVAAAAVRVEEMGQYLELKMAVMQRHFQQVEEEDVVIHSINREEEKAEMDVSSLLWDNLILTAYFP